MPATLRTRHSGYAAQLYNPVALRATLVEAIAGARKILAAHPFDAIAFRGSSGAALAFPLSAALGIPALYVRKPSESSHGRSIEGPDGDVARYLIVDDLVASGATVSAVMDALKPATCAAILLYADEYVYPYILLPQAGVPVFDRHGGLKCESRGWAPREEMPAIRPSDTITPVALQDYKRGIMEMVSSPAWRQLESSDTYGSGK